ncbi:hypothetical protein BGZ76_010623 [Entomortierella beljakovae]|nr:hypothetical protein BGZ76_010623 [Entomortierella beljakovae]
MDEAQHAVTDLPAVLIVGAGLGGLMLGALLEQIDIPYQIFERATVVRPLGGVMTLGAGILPVFEQLGLLEQIKELSKVYRSAELFHADMTELVSFDRTYLEEAVGYHSILFARPKLYELLKTRVPAHKITMGKKVLRTQEHKDRITIHCSDGTFYDGHILVGADGAYSGVRQSLYKQLDEQGLLPKVDTENFSIAYILMVGVAEPKEPEKYPELKEETSRFITVIGGNYKTWGAICTPGNQICWTLTIQVPQMQAEDQQFRNSEWSTESNETMIKEFENLPCPLGGTMGEVIQDTPKELISKVFLEEKVFKTWYHGRTVLLGDGRV